MKKSAIIAVALLSVFMLCALQLAQQAPPVADDDDGGDSRFVGTAFIAFLLPNQPPLPAIATVHGDGTFVSIDGTDECCADET